MLFSIISLDVSFRMNSRQYTCRSVNILKTVYIFRNKNEKETLSNLKYIHFIDSEMVEQKLATVFHLVKCDSNERAAHNSPRNIKPGEM